MNIMSKLQILVMMTILFTTLQPLHSSEKKLTIYTENFPPYNYSDNGKVVGISTEIVKEILRRLGETNDIELKSWTQAYNIVKSKESSILFSTTRTPAREDSFKWVGPLVPNNTIFFAKKGSKLSIKNLNDAKKIRSIGVYSDDFGELLLKEKGFNNLDASLNNSENIDKLINGEIDLWVANHLTGMHMLRAAGVDDEVEKVYEIQKDYMYIAFNKSTPDEVIQKWQKVLNEIKTDGTYAQIFSHWIMFSYSEDLKPTQKVEIKFSQKEKQWMKNHPVIKVATDPDYAPFQYTNQNNQSKGMANDYLKLVAKKLGIEFEMVLTDSWNVSLEQVEKRKADMVLVAAKTPEREKYMSFTSPYAAFPDVIITRKSHKKISSIVELRGKTLASVENFAINEYIKKYYPHVRLIIKPDIASVLNSVATGEVDATVLNVATASNAIEKANITNLRIDGDTGFIYKLSFASRNDWPVLNQLLEKALNNITEKEKKNLLRKWISISYSPDKKDEKTVELRDEEKEWLEQHPIITLAPDPDWAPIEFFDKDGKYSGMVSDYISLLEQRLNIKFHILHLEKWDEILKKSMSGEVDFVTAARSPEREKELLFTEPYLNLPAVIIVNKKERRQLKMDALKGKEVSVVSGYATHEYLEKKHPEIKIKVVSSVTEGLNDVSSGKTYAFLGSIATTSYIIEKQMLINLRVAGTSDYSWHLSFASHKNAPILNRILSKGLASISEKERQDIFKKWFYVPKDEWKLTYEQKIALYVVLGVLFILAIIIWNRLLAKKVLDRTVELNKILKSSEILREKADKAQQEAEQANRAKSEFLASMSHEIRTPMNAIIGMTDIISRSELSKEQQDNIHIVQNAGEHLLSLINDILDLSKIESGQLTLEMSAFDLSETVAKIYEIMSIKNKKDNIDLIFKVEDEIPRYVIGDSTRLQQVLINLVGNALKFTHEGKIILLVKKGENYDKSSILHFSVSDTGVGISKEKRKLIFGAFAQADSSTTRKFGGTGLGLAISKKIIKKMGGNLWVEDNPEGGSIFHFTINAVKHSDEKIKDLKLELNKNTNNVASLNILVADDDPVNLKVATLMLEELNHKVTTASDGLEAVQKIKTANYDLVFMDVGMPNVDGHEATRRIREWEKETNKHILIIALSALVFKEDKQKCLDVGMDYYVSKPFRSENLKEVISKFFADNKDSSDIISPVKVNAIIDKEAALSRAGNDLESLKMIADIYFKHSSEQLVKLEDAVENSDTVNIGSIAHGIKGSLGTLGSLKAFQSALDMEKAAKHADLTDIKNLFFIFKTDVKEFDIALRTFIEEGE